MQPGRSCPLHYRYAPQQLSAAVEVLNADVLYVIGGLYGNVEALLELQSMAAAETRSGQHTKLMFNGDFNWFNAAPADFELINHAVSAHMAILGNVEFEIADPSDDAGCGCAYPDDVSGDLVERSNRIMQRLQQTARQFPEIAAALRALPRYRCLRWGDTRVLVLHGDPESLAGWGLSIESLRMPSHERQLSAWFEQADVDVMACTHSCLPALKTLVVGGRKRVVINNGAAGMGNFREDVRGLITRIAPYPSQQALYGVQLADLWLQAVPVAFNQAAWKQRFLQQWPPGSEAYESYFQRICQGTRMQAADAVLGKAEGNAAN